MPTPIKQIPLIVGVTGHRDLLDEEIDVLSKRIEEFFAHLRGEFPDLPILLVTSLAEGSDTLVTRIALQAGCQVQVVLPMPQHLYAKDFNGESRKELEELCSSNPTLQLPVLEGLSDEQVAQDGPKRDLQYERFGAYLAAHSHVLLALWDGKYNRAIGGTGQVVNFHQRDVSNLTEDEQERSRIDLIDDESDLVYHITCSRQSTGAPEDDLLPGQASWFSRDDVNPRTDEMPIRYHSVLTRMVQFNQDLAALSENTDVYTIDPVQTDGVAASACKEIQSVFGVTDALASRYQQQVLIALKTTLGAAITAGLAFILYADFQDQSYMIWGYLVFVAIAIASYRYAHKKDWQRRYLDYRVLAEGLRVQYYWALAGVEMNNPSRYSHDSFFQGRDLQLGWIRNVLRYTGLLADADFKSEPENVQAAIDGWIGDNDSGQLGYYRAKAKEKLLRHKSTGRLTNACFIAGVLAAAMLAAGQDRVADSITTWLVALMGLLPIIAAARQNYAHRVAERELVAQYAHMNAVFASAYRLVSATPDTGERQIILKDLGEAALNENAQWVLRQRERPLPGGEAIG